jgi:Ca2+-binding EF-hand superfamily protein
MSKAGKYTVPTTEVLQEMQENFEFADGDHDGQIDFGEFAGLMDSLGAEMSGPELRIGFEEIDTDRNGRVGLEEFVAWWTQA